MISCNCIKDGPGAPTSGSADEMVLLAPKATDSAIQKVSTEVLKKEIEQTCHAFAKLQVTPLDPEMQISAFLDVLKEANCSKDPLPEIVLAFESIRKVCAADICFLPFLKDIDALIKRFEGRPEKTRQLLIPLLQQVFSQEMTPLLGHELAGDLLYLIDKDTWETDFKVYLPTYSKLKDQWYKSYSMRSCTYQDTGLYAPRSLERTLPPPAIASMLFLQDGSLNSGIIPAVKKSIPNSLYYYRQCVRQCVLREIREILRDERIGRFLEHVSAPKKGSDGAQIVNTILERPLNQECSLQDTKSALLATAMTVWRQAGVKNCFIVARHLEIREGRLLQYLQDLSELISKGYITRVIAGREIHLFGLPCAVSGACSETFFKECPKHLFDAPAIRNAFCLLGCETADELRQVWAQLPPRKSHSIEELFCQVAINHDASSEALFKARFLIEGPLLAQMWENAVAAEAIMQWPIVQEYLEALGRDYIKRYFADHADNLEAALPAIVSQICKENENIGFSVIPQGEDFACSTVPYIEREGTFKLFDSAYSFSSYINKLDLALFQRIALQAPALSVSQPQASGTPEDSSNRFLHFLKHKLQNCPCRNLLDKIEQTETLEFTSEHHFVRIHSRPNEYAFDKLISFTFFQVPHDFCLENWLSQFFQEKQRLQAIHGADPSFSLLADSAKNNEGKSHVFRFLPFHPSIAGIKNVEDLRQKKELIIEALEKPRYDQDAVRLKLSRLHYPVTDVIIDRIMSLLPPKEVYSVEDIIKSLQIVLFRDEVSAEGLLRYIARFMVTLAQDEPAFTQLLHFADMNSGLHAALWLYPISKNWEFVYVMEDGEDGEYLFTSVISLEDVKIYFYSSQFADVTPKEYVEPDKQLLEFNRKSVKRVQKVEQEFITNWNNLKGYLPSLSKEQIAEELANWKRNPPSIPSEYPQASFHSVLKEAQQEPTSWKQALKACLDLIILYKSVLQSRLVREAGTVEFSLTRALPPAGPLKYLQSVEAFEEAVLNGR